VPGGRRTRKQRTEIGGRRSEDIGKRRKVKGKEHIRPAYAKASTFAEAMADRTARLKGLTGPT